jgi:3-isopropylmalate/(R)-2-methylmalate dehydratase large subunit
MPRGVFGGCAPEGAAIKWRLLVLSVCNKGGGVMGQTIAEKIFSRKALSGEPVKAGQMIEAEVDGLMIGGLRLLDEHVEGAGMTGGLPRLWDPEKVYVMIEHWQPPGDIHLATRNKETREAARRLGVKYFHDATPGIHHQMMFDFGYVRPGELVLGTDSHTTFYGAINAAGTGIGEAEIAYAAVFGELWFQVPPTVKVVLNGSLRRYPFAKDIAMWLAAEYGDDFAQYKAIEFTGPIADAMSIDSRIVLADQSVEMGAKFGLFAADEKTLQYVTGRTQKAFQVANPDPDAEYERVIEVDVDDIPVWVAKPHWFKNGAPITEVAGTKIDQAIVGTCAGGRFEDISFVARMLRGRKVAPGVRFLVSPASYAVMKQCAEAGIIQDILDAGGQFLHPGCGVCQAHTGFLVDGEVNISTATRNHKGRMGTVNSFVYLAGPAAVTDSAIAGEIVDPTEVLNEIGLG